MANKKQAFSVRLNRDAYNMILRQPKAMRIEIGDASSIMVIGERSFDLALRRELSTVQVYKKNQQTRPDDDNRIRYVGDITHVGQMKQILSEDDKKRARSRTEQVEKEKNAKRIELLDVPSIPTPTKLYGNTTPTTAAPLKSSPTKRSNLLSPSSSYAKNTSSSPSSKYLSSSSKNLPSSSSPAPHRNGNGNGGVSRLEGAALANLRERLIHLLALDPRPTDQLIQMLKVASVDLLPLMKKVAVFTNSAWCLRPEVFKEIKIWEWTRYDDKERASVRKKAEDAYDFLKLPRNAPERANLIQRKPRRPSPKLIPPPSQHAPTLGSNNNNTSTSSAIKNDPPTPNGVSHINHLSTISSPVSTSLSSSTSPNIKSTNNINNNINIYNNDTINTNIKRGRLDTEGNGNVKISSLKKRKAEKSTKSRPSTYLESIFAATATSNTTISPPSKHYSSASPANLTAPKKQRPEFKKQKIPAPAPRLNPTESTTTIQQHENGVIGNPTTTDMMNGEYDNDENDDEDPRGGGGREHHHRTATTTTTITNKTYVAPTIHTQLDFDLLCKEHQETQQYYIRFKKTFVQNHPIYAQALAAVNEQDKKMFERKLKAYYKSKGGDMNKWRLLMQLSRRFNGTHAKINIMWDTIEKAYRQKKFSLRFHRKNQSSSSSSSSSSASSSPPSSRPIPASSSKSFKKSLAHR